MTVRLVSGEVKPIYTKPNRIRETVSFFRYPSRLERITTVAWLLVLGLSLAEYALEWVRAAYALLYIPLGLPFVEFLQPFQRVLPTLLTSHLGLFLALIAARAVAFLTPKMLLQHDGLLVQTSLGRRYIPFSAVHALHSVEIEPGGRYLVWVASAKGLPFHGLLASLLLGRWCWRGFLLTSDLQGFEEIVAAIVAELRARYGEEGFASRFREEEPTWLLAMLNSPGGTVRQATQAETPLFTMEVATRQMVSVALAMAIPIVIAGIIHLEFPWGAFVIPLLAMLEWPLASLYFSTIPIGESTHMEFDDALLVYPLTQLPRWVPVIGLTLLVIAGSPLVVLVPAVLIAVALDAYPVLTLTQAWLEVRLPDALLGIVVTVIYQVVLWQVLLALLPD